MNNRIVMRITTPAPKNQKSTAGAEKGNNAEIVPATPGVIRKRRELDFAGMMGRCGELLERCMGMLHDVTAAAGFRSETRQCTHIEIEPSR